MDRKTVKKKVLVIYDYYSPSYKAGGPTQSLINLVTQLYEEFDFEIVCSSYELNPRKPLEGIVKNEWNVWRGICKVFYWDNKLSDIPRLRNTLNNSDADIVFVNGIYSLYFNILPLLFIRKRRIVLSVRGMFTPEALRQKATKKALFLRFFQFMRWQHKVIFHATDDEEAAGIQALLGPGLNVKVAGNFPNVLEVQNPVPKVKGQLKMISISLMNRMKNHLEVLKALQKVQGNVEYVMYGPVHDSKYIEEVLSFCKSLPSNISVTYSGELQPNRVQDQLSQSQLFILPSKSENFGHSIFEALSAGRPVVTSVNTPWKRLQENQAGIAVDLDASSDSLVHAIQTYINMDMEEYEAHCKAAREFAISSVDFLKLKQQYFNLFNF